MADETPKERVDRELIELLNELRVALPGVQVLFAFLLVLPFQVRWEQSTPGCAGMSTVYPTGTSVGVAETAGPAREYRVVHAGGLWSGYVGALKEAGVLESRICWTPDSVLYFTETQDRGDAHGGDTTDHLYFNEAKALDVEGGTWATQDFGASCDSFFPPVNPDVYKCRVDAQDRDTMKMWTDR